MEDGKLKVENGKIFNFQFLRFFAKWKGELPIFVFQHHHEGHSHHYTGHHQNPFFSFHAHDSHQHGGNDQEYGHYYKLPYFQPQVEGE